MTAPAAARVVAARVLDRVGRDAAFADITLEHELSRHAIEPRDAALATELVYGTLRWQRYLDWILAPHASRPLDTVDRGALVLLRLTAYQLRFLERVPAFAAVNDAVTLAREGWGARPPAGRGARPPVGTKPGLERFVNAVLRSFGRAGDTEPAPPADPVETLALRWSFPTWLAARWIARWGMDEATALMRAMNERPPLTVRANTLRTTRARLAVRLAREEGLIPTPTRLVPEGLDVPHGGAPGSWRAFVEGELALQDEASMLVSHLLGPEPGTTVADVCAAPGTKTTHLAQLMEGRGRLLAFDPHPGRLARVREAATRLGIGIIETLDGPIETLAPGFATACDGVLVDAPCSNLGVLRRNPEVKWRRRLADLAANGARQREILFAAATMVKPAGALVYATCSMEPEENEDVARAFLTAHPGFRVDPPADFPVSPDDAGFIRCVPHRHGTDGFTAIRFRRTG